MSETTTESTLMRDEVIDGLRGNYKSLPCKYFYDERGSRLFDAICEVEEYYPTRTELGIMREHLDEIVATIPDETLLIELGSGSSLKTRLILDTHPGLAAYVPVDISGEFLLKTAGELRGRYPSLPITPVSADYTHPFEIPELPVPHNGTVVYFPGSTIGNFLPSRARIFLQQIADLIRPSGGLLIGVDLKKDPTILERAYNDRNGVTAAFNRNLLRRLNRELNADFDLNQFKHRAIYNQALGRVEMYLVSLTRQTVHIDEYEVRLQRNEAIHTENSYKYELEEFAGMAEQAGFSRTHVWTDPARLFSVQYFRISD